MRDLMVSVAYKMLGGCGSDRLHLVLDLISKLPHAPVGLGLNIIRSLGRLG